MRMKKRLKNTTTGEERYRNKDKNMKLTLVCLCMCVCVRVKLHIYVFVYVCVIIILYIVNFWLTRTVFKSIRILFPTLTFLPSAFLKNCNNIINELSHKNTSRFLERDKHENTTFNMHSLRENCHFSINYKVHRRGRISA